MGKSQKDADTDVHSGYEPGSASYSDYMPISAPFQD